MLFSTLYVPFMLSISSLYVLYSCLYYACFVEETLSLASAIKAGAEEVAGITRERYVQRLTWLKEATRLSVIWNHDERKKSVFVRISNMLESLRLDSADGRIRVQPYFVVLCGPPGSGKTGTAMKIASKFIKSRYGKFKNTDVVTLNENDEFQSEYRTNHRVVIFDDVGSDRSAQTDSKNPWRKIIDFVNNVRKTSLNPNLELKGNVYIEPELVIVTTNLDPSLRLQDWLNCPEAILRRISFMLYVHSYDHGCLISKGGGQVLSFTGGVIRTDMKFIYNENDFKKTVIPGNRCEPYKPGELIEISRIVDDFTDQFNDYLDKQEDYTQKMNALLDVDEVCDSWVRCFYVDQVYPRLPKKIVLDPEVEKRLSWYDRFIRCFCVEDPKMAVCHSGSYSPQAGEITDESDGSDSLNYSKSEIPHYLSEYRPFLDEKDPAFRRDLLMKIMKPTHYLELRCLMDVHTWYYIVDTGFAYYRDRYVEFLVASGHCRHKDRDVEIPSLRFSVKEMDEWFEEWFEETQMEEVQETTSEKTYISSPVYTGDVIEFTHHKYPVDFEDTHLQCRPMKDVLRNCQRKLPEMGAVGSLQDCPSSMLTYQVMRRAWHFGFEPLAVEYELNGLTTDGAFRIKDTLVLIEAKTKMPPNDQIKRYLRDAAVDEPVIGVGINYSGYWIYYAGDVPCEHLAYTAMICSAVFRYLQNFGVYFKVPFPFKKYKIHDDTYPPPKKIYT